MKAAWRIIEKAKPWITCTCCGTHVLSLELKDMAKIPQVAEITTKVQCILNRFWGRKRWARKKLREVIERNHGKKLGLYRAKVTRFAGKVKEMARCLRVKNDLLEVVNCYEYAQKNFGTVSTADKDCSDDDDVAGVDNAKLIIQDEAGFWEPLIKILRLCSPVVVLLRMMDGGTPCLGKVYDRMFLVGEHINKMIEKGGASASWLRHAAKCHADRWEYLHSDMHSAAYALDPEFLGTVGDRDDATQQGLLNVIERVCLRDELAATVMSERCTITIDSDAVQGRVAKVTAQLAQYQQREGNFSKAYVLANAKTMAPAQWWDTFGKHLPELASVAKRVLAQPAAASAAERNWSIYGSIKSDRRSQLNHLSADRRVFCHEALHLSTKLQASGYVQRAEAWDACSDSDSLCSDEGEDLDISKLMR